MPLLHPSYLFVGEHFAEVFGVLVFGGKPRSNHIIRSSHAFNALPRQVRVRLVGCQVDGLPLLQREVVEEEDGEEADVSGVLLFSAEDEELLGGEGAGLGMRRKRCEGIGKAVRDVCDFYMARKEMLRESNIILFLFFSNLLLSSLLENV